MKIFLPTILLFLTLIINAQQDPEAKKILDRVTEKTKSYQTIQCKFELVIENKPMKNTSKSVGEIKIKGDRYFIETMGSQVFFDGHTLSSYLVEENEVTLSQPDPSDEDFMENPSKIFTFYNRDFKYHFVGETQLDAGLMFEIDLFPKNLEQPYSRFKIFIRKATEDLYMVSAIGKDGINYTAFLKELKYNTPLPDSQFTFEPSKHKNIEVIDMRF